MITKAQLIEEMQRELGDDGTANPENTVRYGVWVDEIYQRIMSIWGWEFKDVQLSVQWPGADNDADPLLRIPANIGQIVHILRDSDGLEIPYVSKRELVEREADLEATGEVHAWYKEGYESSTGSYLVRLINRPADVENFRVLGRLTPSETLVSSEVIPLPNEFLPALRDGVRFLSMEAEELFEASDRHWQRFNRTVAEVVELLVNHQQQMVVRFNPNADLNLLKSNSILPTVRYPRNITVP